MKVLFECISSVVIAIFYLLVMLLLLIAPFIGIALIIFAIGWVLVHAMDVVIIVMGIIITGIVLGKLMDNIF